MSNSSSTHWLDRGPGEGVTENNEVVNLVAFLFFVWLVPERSQPDWVKNAKSRAVLENTGKAIMSMLPDDPEGLLRQFKRKRDGEEPAEPPAEPPARPQRGAGTDKVDPDEQRGYARGDRVGMQRLLESAAPSAR